MHQQAVYLSTVYKPICVFFQIFINKTENVENQKSFFIFIIPDYYMDDRCGEVIDMEEENIESGNLDLTIFLTYVPNMKCQLTIKAPDDRQIMVYFTEIDIKEKKGRINTCEDYLELFDGSTTYNNSVPGNCCFHLHNTVPSICCHTTYIYSHDNCVPGICCHCSSEKREK